MKKRLTSPAERRLFEKTLAASPSLPAVKPESVPKTKSPKTKARGQNPEARLDLHGLTEDAAHGALLVFLRGARKRGLKLVLVITGKGAHVAADAPYRMELDRRPRGVLKNVVPRWLGEKPFAALVGEISPAKLRDGGEGALYVYLCK